MGGRAAKTAPLAHRHHKVEAFLFRDQGGIAILFPAAVQRRRSARNDPSAVRYRQEDAVFFGSGHAANFISFRTRSRALRVATGRKTPYSLGPLMPVFCAEPSW